MNKIIDFIKKNKVLFLLCIIVLMVFIYCSFNTFITNDDLPYSFYYRSDVRITNIFQAFKNQIADYFHINGRVILHFIVQSLLIFNKNLWSILNPIVIIISFVLILLISNYFQNNNKNNNNNIVKFLVIVILFLCLFDFKYLIYWIAGSVNYVWLSTIILGFIYYYLRKGLDRNYIINFIIILFISILHESSLVFMLIFIVFHLIIKKFKHEKINKKNILYLVAIGISALFIFLCPGNNIRLNNSEWNHLSLISKLLISIPVVSKNVFNLKNVYNIVPIIYVLSLLFGLSKLKDKRSKLFIILNLVFSCLAFIFNNGYIYFVWAILLLITDIYISYYHKRFQLINITLGFYAIAFSMILVSEYAASRPNYFFYIYSIMIVVINIFNDEFKNIILKKIMTICLVCIFSSLLVYEGYIYKNIGDVYRSRVDAIDKCREDNCSVLILKRVPSNVSKYHVDPNAMNRDYFAYRYFINYYDLPDVEIKYMD